jgi:V8-like Glu-specific endopeptidase
VDRSNGRCLYKSSCAFKTAGCDAPIIPHKCDLTAGESGAPLITRDNVIRAIGLGTYDKKSNSAVLLDDELVGFVDVVLEGLRTPTQFTAAEMPST